MPSKTFSQATGGQKWPCNYNWDTKWHIFCGFREGRNLTWFDLLCFQDHDHPAKLQCKRTMEGKPYQQALSWWLVSHQWESIAAQAQGWHGACKYIILLRCPSCLPLGKRWSVGVTAVLITSPRRWGAKNLPALKLVTQEVLFMLSQPAEDFAITAFLRSRAWGWKWPRTASRPEDTVERHTQLQEGALGSPPPLVFLLAGSHTMIWSVAIATAWKEAFFVYII